MTEVPCELCGEVRSGERRYSTEGGDVHHACVVAAGLLSVRDGASSPYRVRDNNEPSDAWFNNRPSVDTVYRAADDPDAGYDEVVYDALGWCPCGNPEDVADVFVAVLEGAAKQGERPYGVEYEMAAQVLDLAGFLDHGGAVTGGWLTDEGKALLDRIRACPKNDDPMPGGEQ